MLELVGWESWASVGTLEVKNFRFSELRSNDSQASTGFDLRL